MVMMSGNSIEKSGAYCLMIVWLYEEERQMIAQMNGKSKIYHRPDADT